mmetsp:Transcript_13288/g.18678  ORF Transcript_13288/g.18678 Transcript_13288/m.18678 type:complete len:89 (+) Transcript_13288:36-302(+)
MSFKLYSPFGYTRSNFVKIAADIASVKFEDIIVSWDEMKSPEFLKKNPLGKAPVIETNDGFLYETNAILRFIARLNPSKNLQGQGIFE